MAEHKHHHHHHHRHHRDSASIYKHKTLREIELRKLAERIIKIALYVIAIIMAIAVIVVYKFA